MSDLWNTQSTDSTDMILSYKKNSLTLIIISVISLFILFLFEKFFINNYWVKSSIKILLFSLPILFMIKIYGINSFKKLFKIRFNDLKIALFLGITAMISIISTYYLTNGIIDYSNVPKSLENSLGISLDNFLFVGLYIAVFNSLLEEMIFRGVLYINLSKGISEKMTIILSSFLFSIYHISIVDGWFNFLSFLLVITLLMLSGIVLNLLDRKTGSILPSWILHIFSNIGINAIGYILLNAK